MSAIPYHKRYHSDALAGFMSLTLEERGAYQTLLDLIYDRGGPILDSERLLAGYMGVSIRKWKSIRDCLLSKGKIYITTEGLISNIRAEKEIENFAKTSRKRAENGSKGGRKKAESRKNANENNEPALANGKQNPSHSRVPEVITLPNGKGEPPNLSELLWGEGLAYLIRCGVPERNARSLLGKWRKRLGEPQTAAALAHCQAKSISDPVAYIEAVKPNGSDADEREQWLRKRYGATV